MPLLLKRRKVIDPTRTTTVRRAFIAELRRRFARLKGEIVKLLLIDDAFGLKRRMALNAFCPTGEGGGIDPTCSPGTVSALHIAESGQVNREELSSEKFTLVEIPLDFASHQPGWSPSGSAISSGPIIVDVNPFSKTGVEILDGNHRVYEARMRGERTIRAYVGSLVSITTNVANVDPPVREWQFRTSSEQVAAFQRWLRRMFGRHLSVDQLMQRYAEEGYRRGAGRAFDDVPRDLFPDDSTRDFYTRSRREFLRDAFSRPIGKERINQLAQRSLTDLVNVTEDMATRMSRSLLDGLTRGDHPREIARGMSADLDISRARAETIARTEVIRAHAEGQLDAMTRMGVGQVGVQVEWVTAKDDRVCPACEAYEGTVLPIERAHNLIPFHPNAVFAGSTFQSYGELKEIVRAWYCGPSVILVAAGGYRTTIGPNHPVFTQRGMIPAAELNKSDKILYDLRINDARRLADIHLEKIPLVEDVFNTIVAVGEDSCITTSSSDLHGDRVFCKGEVQAVSPARSLLDVLDPCGIEHLRERFLVGSDAESKCVSSIRSSSADGQRVFIPSPGGMRGPDSWVVADDRFVWLNIHSVSFGTYEGYAFDATTHYSIYCSDGFVVKNCRCAWLPAGDALFTEAELAERDGG